MGQAKRRGGGGAGSPNPAGKLASGRGRPGMKPDGEDICAVFLFIYLFFCLGFFGFLS
jgi:hypothetical protein